MEVIQVSSYLIYEGEQGSCRRLLIMLVHLSRADLTTMMTETKSKETVGHVKYYVFYHKLSMSPHFL